MLARQAERSVVRYWRKRTSIKCIYNLSSRVAPSFNCQTAVFSLAALSRGPLCIRHMGAGSPFSALSSPPMLVEPGVAAERLEGSSEQALQNTHVAPAADSACAVRRRAAGDSSHQAAWADPVWFECDKLLIVPSLLQRRALALEVVRRPLALRPPYRRSIFTFASGLFASDIFFIFPPASPSRARAHSLPDVRQRAGPASLLDHVPGLCAEHTPSFRFPTISRRSTTTTRSRVKADRKEEQLEISTEGSE